MLKTRKANIILALCISCVLIGLTFYGRYTGVPIPAEVFYAAGAIFFLARGCAGKGRCEG